MHGKNFIELRINAGNKNASNKKDSAIADTYGDKFLIPLDFEMLDSSEPFYQAGLGNRLCYEITFSDHNRVIKSAVASPDAKYVISNLSLEYEIITQPTLAKHISDEYQNMALLYDRIFAEGKQKDNNANEVQKHLQLHNVNVGEYFTDKYVLWLHFRTIDKSALHGMGRKIENASEGITLQIEKKAESTGPLNVYIYLIMDAQLNIQNGAYVSAMY